MNGQIRSPSYPATSLRDALAQVQKIEAQYRTGQVDREVAAKILGYSGLNGPSNKALAALAHYGLVERAGKGEMRVTQRAKAILHPDNGIERRDHLRAAALEPQLYRELQERWPGHVPPEDGVVTYLNRQGFNRSAVPKAAKAYRETMLFLEEEGGSESHGIGTEGGAESGQWNEPKADDVMADTETLERPPAEMRLGNKAPTAEAATVTLNRIDMNIQGDKVLLSGLLDRKGLDALEKKIKALRVLLEVYEEGNDTGEGNDG